MDQFLKNILGKYKYAIAVLLVGVVLMLLPQGTQEPAPVVEETTAQEDLESTLEAILAQIEGAGRVEVLLTRATDGEVVYQSDTRTDVDGESSSHSQDTVIVEQEDQEVGLIRQRIEPDYRGAVIVCEGADSPAVRLAIVEAVSCVTGLGADRISVQKMK